MAKTVVLSGGRQFTVNEVGPGSWAQFLKYNTDPVKPYDEQENDLGTLIKVKIPDDDPRMEIFYREVVRYMGKQREASYLALFHQQVDVPDDWDIPHSFKRYGVEKADNPDDLLVQYVQFEIVKTNEDVVTLERASSGDIDPVEVAAQAVQFQSDVQ
jgi:hypothetical protein